MKRKIKKLLGATWYLSALLLVPVTIQAQDDYEDDMYEGEEEPEEAPAKKKKAEKKKKVKKAKKEKKAKKSKKAAKK